jgi:SAM-dependent methyltransferase
MTNALSRRLAEYQAVLNHLDEIVALESLREVGVFQALLSGPKDLATLAAETETDGARLQAFLDLVRSMGFLSKKGNQFRLVEGDEDLFDPDGPVGGNPGFPDLQKFLRRRGAATEVLRTGQPLASPSTGGTVSTEMRREFLQHVHDSSQGVAQEVAELLAHCAPRRFADLGCGPGTYTVAMLQQVPSARGILVDRENARGFVEGLCTEAGLQGRTEFLARDILVDDLGEDLDLVLLSENIHNFGPSQNLQLFHNVARSLVQGGRVAIKDTRVAADRSGPLGALRFAYTLSIFSPQGTLYTEEEVVTLLEQAGLVHEETLDMAHMPGSYLVIARKPGAI